MKLRIAVCLLPSLCLAQPDFRANVHLVNIDFSVRDSGGKLVTGLTPNDFEVLEDGVPQKIAFFAPSQDVPLTLGLVVDISDSANRELFDALSEMPASKRPNQVAVFSDSIDVQLREWRRKVAPCHVHVFLKPLHMHGLLNVLRQMERRQAGADA